MLQNSNLITEGVGSCVGKPVVDFLFVIIELFLYLLRLRLYKRKSVEVGVFRRRLVTLSANFRRKGASPTNQCWCQKTTLTVLSCGLKISAVHCLVLLQSTRVTDGRTDGQNYDSQDRASIAASRGNNESALMHQCAGHNTKLHRRILQTN